MTLPWECVIQRSARRRRLAVRIGTGGAVTVLAPERASERAIEAFLAQCRNWIESRRAEVRERLAQSPPKRFVEGERFLLRGEPCELGFSPSLTGEVRRIGNWLVAPVGWEGSERLARLLTGFFRAEAQQFLEARTRARAAELGICLGRIGITSAAHRWGSCSRGCDVNFSWRLIQCPPSLIDYVIAHELAHTREMNHSPRFYAVLNGFLPEWRERQRELRKEGWKYAGW